MSLRLALVIDGNAAGAKKALAETASAVEDVGKKAAGTSRSLGAIGDGITAAGAGAPAAAGGIQQLGDAAAGASGKLGGFKTSAQFLVDLPASAPAITTISGGIADLGAGLREAGSEGPKAAGGIAQVGDALRTAAGKIDSFKSGFKGLFGGVVGGLVGGLAAGALSGFLDAATASAVAFAEEIVSSGPEIRRALSENEAMVRRIKGAFDEAQGAASSYGRESRALLTFQQQGNVRDLEKAFRSSLSDMDLGNGVEMIERLQRRMGAGNVPFAADVEKFRADLKDGAADVIAFRNTVAEQAAGLAADSPFRAIADAILASTEQSAQLQAELQRAIDLYKGLTGDAGAAATALGGAADKLTLTGQAAAGSLGALRDYDALLRQIGSQPLPAAPAAGGLPGPPSPQRPGPEGRGFADGGFTGWAARGAVAGFVHGQEYVFDAEATQKIGVDNLDRIRRGVKGYAAGGYVGFSPAAGVEMAGGAAAGGWGGWKAEFAQAAQFFQGSLSGIVQELRRGAGAGEVFAKKFEQITDRFLDFALGKVEQLVFGGGSSGGLFSGLFGGGSGGSDPWAGLRAIAVPGFARGTSSAPGGLAWVGEEGPELVELPAGSRVHPAGRSREMAGGTTVHHWHVSTPSPRAFAEAQATVARSAARFTGRMGRYS